MENTLFFYNILLFFLICIFIPSVYNYLYNNFIGRIVLLLLIIYFSKINFYLGLIFITIIIILSSSLYEGFIPGQYGIITTNYSVKESDRKDPQKVFDYFRDFYCSPSNKNTPNQTLMNEWNNLANTSRDSNIVAVSKKNIENANMICSSKNIPVPEKDLEWNINNAKIKNKCMGGFTYIGGSCFGLPGTRYSPYSWTVMKNYNLSDFNDWVSTFKVNNTDVALANAEKLRNAENSCGAGSSRIFNKPTCLLNNMDAMCSSIKSIDSQINNVLNSNSSDQSFQRHAQFLKNTYDDYCIQPSNIPGPLLR